MKNNQITELQNATKGLFNGKLPVNHPLVQMMINDKIARLELEEAKEYWANQPKRKGYFYEKLRNLTAKVLHYIKMKKQDKTKAKLLLGLQSELLILTNAKPDWTSSFIDVNVLRLLLQEY